MGLLDTFTENLKSSGEQFAAPVLEKGDGVIEIARKDGGRLAICQAVEREVDGKTYYIRSGPTETQRGYLTYEASCEKQIISVLGTVYSIQTCSRAKDSRLEEMDGLCDDSTKEIVLAQFEPISDSKRDLETVRRKILRHEITHAFLCESGLAENSDWAQNEELVDWIAIQGPKIWKAWQEAGAV